ncbi:hypothetical protein CN523_31585 [Bacillus cereus]|nr:hypothetical protein CN523_31585 [Bacillus cereus]
MVHVNGKCLTETKCKEFKELIWYVSQNPLVASKGSHLLGCLPAREPPLEKGVGGIDLQCQSKSFYHLIVKSKSTLN